MVESSTFVFISPVQNPTLIIVIITKLISSLSISAEIVAPGNLPIPPDHHALTHATVVTKPGITIKNATIVLNNSRIVSVTENGEPPETARIWDMRGHTIYPGFIDPYVTDVKPISTTMTQRISGNEFTATGKPGFFGTIGNEIDPGNIGPGAGLSTIKPDFDVTDNLSPKTDTFEAHRKQGFTAIVLTPGNGIIRGQSALISLKNDSPNKIIIKPHLFQHIAFDSKASKTDEFPKSLMGVISAIRQAFADAQHYESTWKYYKANSNSFIRPSYNQSLNALKNALHGNQRTIIEPGSILMVDKAIRLGKEFGIKPVIVASGQEWRRPNLIKSTQAEFIVPLIIPKVPKMPSQTDWENVSLDILRAWDWAPEIPRILHNNGHSISLTLHGLKDKNQFRANLAKAIERGLPKKIALAALTTTPAELTKSIDQIGTIEAGKLASLMITDGDYFNPKTKIKGVWIEGQWNSFEPSKLNWVSKKETEKKDNKKEEKEPEKDQLNARSPVDEVSVFEPKNKTIHIKNATIWTSSKRGILKKHDILIVKGKIKKIARNITTPKDAHTINGQGLHITPGLIDAHSHSMILGMVNEGTLPSTAMVSIGDVVNSESPEIYRQLAGGLTVANLLHGSANPIGGQNAVIKLRLGYGPEGMKFKAAPPGIKFALGENVKQSNWGEKKVTRFPQSRMGVPAFHENRFTAAWQYNRKWRKFKERGGAPPRRDLELETLGQIIKAERWIHCHSYRQDEILAFMRTMEKFGVRIGTLQHVLEGYKIADEIAAHGAGASCFSDWWGYKYEVIDAIPYAGSLMHKRGVVVSFNSDSSDLARRMNLESAKAVKYGNTKPSEALNFVTLNPAKQLRIDHRVGSLEPGKDADFAVWSDSPLSTRSICLETWIEGKRFFERNEGITKAESRSNERKKLLEKAQKLSKTQSKKDKKTGANPGITSFFQRALETAHGLNVVDCQDCKVKNN